MDPCALRYTKESTENEAETKQNRSVGRSEHRCSSGEQIGTRETETKLLPCARKVYREIEADLKTEREGSDSGSSNVKELQYQVEIEFQREFRSQKDVILQSP
ncbi:hypothetical protein Rs2_09759 [Raphanus sativus]|nr:hypothetical protein Rs2_09759 [Raphanus sativus]